MAPLKCSVTGCNATSESHCLYSLPKDDNLRSLWLSFLLPVCPQLNGLTKKQLLRKQVCHQHFDRHQMDGQGRRLRLSYPSLFSAKEIAYGMPLTSEEYHVQMEHNYFQQQDKHDNAEMLVDRTVGEPQNPTDVDSVLLKIKQNPASNCDLPAAGVNSTEKTDMENIHDEITLDSEALEILGGDPDDKTTDGNNVHRELAIQLELIATCGLNTNHCKELIGKYPIPDNCAKIAAPGLNPEIKAAVPDIVTKMDRLIETRQEKIATVLSCLANALSAQLEAKKTRDNELLKHLMDACSLLCDVQHDESLARRIGVISTFKKETKKSLYNTNIDKLLFGENLTDSLKTAKTGLKSGKGRKTLNKKPLKRKSPVAARRKPPKPRRPASAAAATSGAATLKRALGHRQNIGPPLL